MSEYDEGASDGRADKAAAFDGFFNHLLGLGEARRFTYREVPGRWVVRCEGWVYSDYETGYLVGFLGANPHGLQ